jgi:hypothetical protein
MPYSTLTPETHARPYAAGDCWRATQEAEKVADNLDDHESRIVALEAGGGSGNVVGPASATDNAIARYDGITGELLQNSGITVADGASGTLSGSNSGDVTLAGTPNYLTLAAQVITRALIDLASHITGRLPYANLTASTAANRLLGRGSGAGAGDWQEVALGTGLSLSGTTLNASLAPGSSALDDLSDVVISSPVDDQFLRYNGSTWVNETVATGGAALDDLTDVTITSATQYDILHYNGSAWINKDTPRLVRVGIAVDADSSAKLKIAGQYGSTLYDAGNSSTALTLDWNNGNTQLTTLTGNCTFTLSNPKDGFRYLIILKQDGTGSRIVTWPSSVKWSAGTTPTLSTTAGKVDVVTLVWVAGIGASGNYLAAANTDYTPA